jgi:hypothetical protein
MIPMEARLPVAVLAVRALNIPRPIDWVSNLAMG